MTLNNKFIAGVVTTILTFMSGIWVFLAPFIVDYQDNWKSLIDATKNDFLSGGALVAISAITFIAVVALALRGALKSVADELPKRTAVGLGAHFVGAVGGLLSALAGFWLMVAPFALAYQAENEAWADPTIADFWAGVVVIAISLIGLLSYVWGIFDELRERGLLSTASSTGGAPAPSSAPDHRAQEADLEQVLRPLVAAMLADAQQGRAPEQEEQTTPQLSDPAEERQR